MQLQIFFFVSIAFSFIAWGMGRSPIHLAGAAPPAAGRGVAASAHSAQLSLHRVSISGARGRVVRLAVCLRTFRRLWGYDCGNTRLAGADLAAQCVRRGHRMDLQSLGYIGPLQCLLPGQSRRADGGATGSHVFHPDSHRAPIADHARTRFPDSSAT